MVFVRCVGEDERGSGGGRVARLVFSPGPRVVETLTLPVSRALFLSLCPKALVDGRGRLAFSLGCRFGGAREESGPVSTDGGDFGGRVIVFSDASNTRGGCWGERERTATRVAGVWCERRTLVLCRAPAMRDARTLSSFSARLYSIDLYV